MMTQETEKVRKQMQIVCIDRSCSTGSSSADYR